MINISYLKEEVKTMVDAVAVLEKTEAAVEPQTLKGKYNKLGEEFRNLGIKQNTITRENNGGLTPEEVIRRTELQEMASFGLFEDHWKEADLAELETEFYAEKDAEAKGLNPIALRDEYSQLSRKIAWSESADRTSPAEHARLKWFERLRKQKKI